MGVYVFVEDAEEDAIVIVFLWKTRRKTHFPLCLSGRRSDTMKHNTNMIFFTAKSVFQTNIGENESSFASSTKTHANMRLPRRLPQKHKLP